MEAPGIDPHPLRGRRAIVTGSSRRIGRQIALALAERGCRVIVNAASDRDGAEAVAAQIRSAGGQAVSCLADVTNPEEVDRLAEIARDQFGGLDILVNNAAIRRPARLADMTLAEWRAVTSVILDGAYLCSRAVLPYLQDSGHGRIVNIGGISAHVGAEGRAHVSAAKAGLVGLTRALAVELAPSGVTVNCLSPGLIEEPDDDAQASRFRRNMVPNVPLGRAGSPREVGLAVAALCGDDLAYITGQTIHLNGGAFFG